MATKWRGLFSLISGVVKGVKMMLKPEIINPKEIPLIEEIVKNETWLLGEKVGREVDPKCEEVLSRVIEIVLNSGAQWRTSFESGCGDLNTSQ